MPVVADAVSVSVIIPAYNIVRYLGRCVESVVRQTVHDIEIIVVDDGSTDGTATLADTLAETYGLLVIHQPNGGPGAARNAGLDVARGEYVAFVDGDDVVHERYLEVLLDAMQRREADVAQAGYVLLGADDRAACDERMCRRPLPANPCEYVSDGREALADMLYQRPGRCDSSLFKLYRRSLFAGGLRLPTDRYVFEDVLLLARLMLGREHLTVVAAVVPVYFYFKQAGGTLVGCSRQRTDAFDVCDILMEEVIGAGALPLVGAVQSRKLAVAFHTLRMRPEPAVAAACWQAIVDLRGACMWNRNVRLKIKLGIALSLLGRRTTEFVLGHWFGI